MNINSIILEEINTLLNESYVLKDDKFKFRQILTNSRFSNYDGFTSEFDTNISESSIAVNWNISFWLNESGIENLIINVDSVEGSYKVDYYNLHSDALEQETQKDIAEFNWKYFIDDEALIQKGGSLYVSSLDFDFKTNTCTVIF